MSSLALVFIAALVISVAIAVEAHQRSTYCAAALKRARFGEVVALSGGARGTRRVGSTTVSASLTPTDDDAAARIELVFASTPATPSLNARSRGAGLTHASAATLGWGGERWVASLSEVLRCLGTPAPARFDECEEAFFLDVDEIVTTDFDTTVHATAYTNTSGEFNRRLKKLGMLARMSSPHNSDSSRQQTIGDALDALVGLAQALDGATRRHGAGPHVALWRRAWRGTSGPGARAEALTLLARALGDEDALWLEARAFGDTTDLVTLWRRDPDRARDVFDLGERAALLGVPRHHAPELHDALLSELEPAWLDELDWARARPLLALMRSRFGVSALAPHLAHLSRRLSDTERAELVAALGPDAQAMGAGGGLSLAEDDSARGALTSADARGGVSPVE